MSKSDTTSKLMTTVFALTCLGAIFMIVGGSLNLYVVKENDCMMPVLSDYDFNSPDHVSFTNYSEILHPDLADVHILRTWKYNIHYSFGDVLVILGILIIFIPAGIIVNYKNKLRYSKYHG